MRFLGIDYGTKRIGVAISDEKGILAFPKGNCSERSKYSKKNWRNHKSGKYFRNCSRGISRFSGKLNVLSARIEIFISELKEKFQLPIHKQKEFLTSVEARRHQDFGGQARKSESGNQHNRLKQIKSGRIDASAAALILQRYLDK